MKIQLESTTKIVHANGVPCRVWEGATESGIGVTALILRIAVARSSDTSQFERELKECRAPSAETEAFSMRMIL